MPYKKLLIASFALSGLVNAQCNYKCGYNQDENGNTIHLKQCNEYKDSKKKTYPKHYTEEDIEFLEEQNENVVKEEDKTPSGSPYTKN